VVAAVTIGAALMGCSGDDGGTQTVTTPSIDVAQVERDVQCELAKSYVNFETTRGTGADPVTAQNFETRRVQALDRVLATFKGNVPPEVSTASDQLRLLPITAEQTDDTMTKVTASLKQFTDYFDPKCGTEGGRDPSDDTTLPPISDSGSTTTAATGATASTAGTAPTTATTAATTASSTG
jgi:hypothetical protein